MPKKPRDYKKEYQYHSSPEQIANRAARNKARREAIKDGRIEPGSPKEIDHIKPLDKGGSKSKKNTRVVSRAENRKKYNKD